MLINTTIRVDFLSINMKLPRDVSATTLYFR